MLQKIKNRKQEGFTIIEVLIVLAIAGLIMLIVFLAVPALQRNSRNTALKNDASAIAGGISEFASNNNGSMVTTIAKTAGAPEVTLSGGTSSIAATAKVNGSDTVNSATSAPSALSSGTITVVLGKKCDGTSAGRAAAIYYAVEKNTGAPGVACLES